MKNLAHNKNIYVVVSSHILMEMEQLCDRVFIIFDGKVICTKTMDEINREQIERRVEIAEYRLGHNITKDYEKNIWWFFADNSFNWVFRFIILIVVLVRVFNVSSEYNNKTINMWLVSLYNIWKVLTYKYLAIIEYGTILSNVNNDFDSIIIQGFIPTIAGFNYNGVYCYIYGYYVRSIL